MVTVDPNAKIATTLTPYTGTVAPDMGPIYQLTSTDQRHKATFNGIWDIGKGLQLSGLYFYGSGQRFSTSWGSDLRNTGGASYNILTPATVTVNGRCPRSTRTRSALFAAARSRVRSITASFCSTARS